MKLNIRYPNYKPTLINFIGDYNPQIGYDDSKQISFVVQQSRANGNKAKDHYELNSSNEGFAYFQIATMIGFRNILTTTSPIIEHDLSIEEWSNLISSMSTQHFMDPKYQALKQGFVKQRASRGCLVFLVALIAITSILTFI